MEDPASCPSPKGAGHSSKMSAGQRCRRTSPEARPCTVRKTLIHKTEISSLHSRVTYGAVNDITIIKDCLTGAHFESSIKAKISKPQS